MDEGTSTLLIQGLFFQEGYHPEVAAVPGEGNTLVMRSGLFSAMFAGMIFPSSDALRLLTGHMIDRFGDSVLSDVHIGDTELRFSKQYADATLPISYSFRRYGQQGGLWVGEFAGEECGTGAANCVLASIPARLLRPTYLSAALAST